uniref:Uncharacterized protein n=1 Tax=Citrobacter freundii TaxID=546 RepID=A0A0K2S4G7_CITFR|nr:hypothetical protein [Citrobacter freundii]BAS21715.1 hypothetical protein [Citrobacter freundii]
MDEQKKSPEALPIELPATISTLEKLEKSGKTNSPLYLALKKVVVIAQRCNQVKMISIKR